MEISKLKNGMILKNTNTTIFVKIISVEENGFTAKELGNCVGLFDIQKINEYSKASLTAGSWVIK